MFQKRNGDGPTFRKVPVAETSTKSKGNEGTGGGKGENTIVARILEKAIYLIDSKLFMSSEV
jgi:hypothetical protein